MALYAKRVAYVEITFVEIKGGLSGEASSGYALDSNGLWLASTMERLLREIFETEDAQKELDDASMKDVEVKVIMLENQS